MTVSDGLLHAIAEAVIREGGTAQDARDLVEVWARVERDWQPRVDTMRRETAHPICRCVDGFHGGDRDRCARCWRFERRARFSRALNSGSAWRARGFAARSRGDSGRERAAAQCRGSCAPDRAVSPLGVSRC